MKLVKTGIAGLDEFLTGGLPPKVILLIGPPGSGNEVFARQISYTRAKQAGITYFTIAATAENVRDDMEVYGWDIASLEKSGNWKFKKIAENARLDEAIVKEMEENQTVVIDSFSELLLTRKIGEITNLISVMSHQNKNSENYHLLLLTEGMQDPKTETIMQHFAEGVIMFATTLTADTMHTDILIKKIKGSFVPTRRLPYSISKKGFLIETATRIT